MSVPLTNREAEIQLKKYPKKSVTEREGHQRGALHCTVSGMKRYTRSDVPGHLLFPVPLGRPFSKRQHAVLQEGEATGAVLTDTA